MKKALSNMLIAACLTVPCLTHAVEPTFWLKNKDAKMPVVIRGNIQSSSMIVFLHGGPGGTALKKIGTRAFNALEQDFAVVYWNQRGADKSKGGNTKKHLNLHQFVEDLDMLIDHIETMYPGMNLFLMGHCWGGALATAYLADEHRQNKITGWIMIGGAYNNPKGDSLSMEWVKAHARTMIERGEQVRYWRSSIRWYDRNPGFSSAQLRHYNFVRKANGYQLVKGDSLGIYPCYTNKDILKKPDQFVGYNLNYYRTLKRFVISDIDLSHQLSLIKIPFLVFWGSEDGLIPVELGREAYEKAGASPEHKLLIVYEEVAHTIYYEHPTGFSKGVAGFICRYNSVGKPGMREIVLAFDKSGLDKPQVNSQICIFLSL
jgi:pimeloyl-ACP methyl ester carboxylesterase